MYFKLSSKVGLIETNRDVTDILYGGHFKYGGQIQISSFWIVELPKHSQNINCVKFWASRIKNNDSIEKSLKMISYMATILKMAAIVIFESGSIANIAQYTLTYHQSKISLSEHFLSPISRIEIKIVKKSYPLTNII